MPVRTIVCFGDSIVEGEGDCQGRDGWVGRLREKLVQQKPSRGHGDDTSESWRVFNLGIGGDTSRDLHYRIGEMVLRKPEIIILGCGDNDVVLHTQPDSSRVPKISHVRSDRAWNDILDICHRQSNKVLVLGGIENGISRPAMEAKIKEVSQKVSQIGEGVEMLLSINLEANKHFSHDIYPNAAGYEEYFKQVYAKLEDLSWLE